MKPRKTGDSMANIVSFGKEIKILPRDTTLDTLVTMTNQTCVVGLNKVLTYIEETESWRRKSINTKNVGERMQRAAECVALCLPRR